MAAAEQLLRGGAYQAAELEELLGVKLDDLFAGNNSQLRSVAFAQKNGERTHWILNGLTNDNACPALTLSRSEPPLRL